MFRAYLPTLFPLFSPNFFFPKKKEKSFPFQSGLDSIRLLCLFSIFYFLFSQNIYSQDTLKRPKIGVVLSGGGAKGFAHIGVLKVLEQAGVKIDYIGGTSMGAVVGGLYATGYSATQIDSIFKATNFDELLQDYIPRTSKNFYEKQNDERYAVSLPFRKFSLGVPIALSKGMYNYNLLAKLTHNVRHVRDFNQLSIPFVCVATDIESGKEVIMHSGYLAQAMLASSAFPTLFSPVEIDGRLLIDGGVSNNYPVEEIRKMGADIVIGVDVQDDLKDRNALNDATRILVQISNLQMIESMKDKILKTDMYIKPDISKFTVISFDQGDEIIKRGEEAAFACYEKIKSYGRGNYQLNELKTKVDSLNINKIIVNDLKNYTASYVIGTLGFKQGSTICYDDLKKGINTLNATQNFSTISYTIEKNENGGDDLHIDLTEIKTKSFLKFGLHYDGLYKSAVLVNLTQKKSLFRNDVLSVDFALGDNFRYDLDYYVDNGFYFSFGLKSRYNQFNRNVSTDFNNGSILNQFAINKLNIDFSDLTNQAYLQTLFFQKFLIGGGVELKHISIESRTLQDNKTIFEDSDYLSLFGSVKYDSFDNKYFPKKGWFFNGDIHTYLYSTNFTNQFNRFSIMKGEVGITRTFYKRFNVKFTSDAGFSFGESSVHFLDFVLGGYGFNAINNFKHFYGYDFISLAGDSYIKSAATVDVEFYKKNHLNFSANFANVENKLFSTGNWLSTPMYSGYAIGYGLETVLGPIELKYSWSPELPKGFTWISVGFWF